MIVFSSTTQTKRKEIYTNDAELIKFTQELVRTKSLPGQEKPVSELIVKKMNELGYDESFIDDIGNVVGIIKGKKGKPKLMLTGHTDHVTEGLLEKWKTPPYSAEIHSGAIWGRATADMKGAVAAMVFSGGDLASEEVRNFGDLIVGAVVLEEPSLECIGTKYLFEGNNLEADYALIGEATNFDVAIGGRGRVEFEVTAYGKPSHSSAPWRGINAVYKMAKFVEELQKLNDKLPEDGFLGKASLCVTAISCFPGDPDMDTVPERCSVVFERRIVPPEDKETAMKQIQDLITNLEKEDKEFKAEANLRSVVIKDTMGNTRGLQKLMGNPWLTDQNSPIVKKSQKAVTEVLGRPPAITKYTFGTDANYIAGVRKIPTVGLGPGEERFTHTYEEHLKIDDLIAARRIYSKIATSLP